MRQLILGKQFRPQTSHVYPPFKNGRYMEEYAYEYYQNNKVAVGSSAIYIPIFWTNLQNHPGFQDMKAKYNALLQIAIDMENNRCSEKPVYFTIVQHDDGPLLDLPKGTIIFGACTGTLPLPLIYEDITNTLLMAPRLKKDLLASFVGSITHPIRDAMCNAVKGHNDIICNGKNGWTPSVPSDLADQFIALTLRSKFCLAPRGYGRSSFRFFEAMLLDTIPVYIWDDKCWLPYKDCVAYSSFSVCIHANEIDNIYEILSSITDEEYDKMQYCMRNARKMFTLEWMCKYICRWI
jgi:hypothetical protein